MDFLATVMEVLKVDRPAAQKDWALDGKSITPILKGENWPERGVGWMYASPTKNVNDGYGFRYGKWKYVQGSISCHADDCKQPQLFDLEVRGRYTHVWLAVDLLRGACCD
jgi:hypothetical protein